MSRHRSSGASGQTDDIARAGGAYKSSDPSDLRTLRTQRIETLVEPSLFKVLFVCTGNLHRSVMGERLMRNRIRPGLPVAIRSAGTHAALDQPIGEYSAVALKELGANPDGHQPQQLVPAVAATADLILTAEVAHRQVVLLDTPAAVRRAFSLREFARLAEKLGPLKPSDPFEVETVRARVLDVSAQRGLVQRAARSEDIADPVRASMSETRARAREIAECVDAVIETLGLGRE